MRYSKPTLRDSFFGWLGVSMPPAAADAQEGLKRIRERMMDELIVGPTVGAAGLIRRILRAEDALALWYCRGELMQALSQRQGETAARAVVADLTRLFDGLLPAGLIPSGQGSRRR
jgi:hypothetical protein